MENLIAFSIFGLIIAGLNYLFWSIYIGLGIAFFIVSLPFWWTFFWSIVD